MDYLQTKNSQFGYILEGLGMENVVIYSCLSEYFMVTWHNVWQFGIVCGHLVYFSHFGMFGPRKIWNHGGKHSGCSHETSLSVEMHSFRKLPPYTVAGFGLTTLKFLSPQAETTPLGLDRAL
jgi:hypothetical protein